LAQAEQKAFQDQLQAAMAVAVFSLQSHRQVVVVVVAPTPMVVLADQAVELVAEQQADQIHLVKVLLVVLVALQVDLTLHLAAAAVELMRLDRLEQAAKVETAAQD
jgi:hypothetical protein